MQHWSEIIAKPNIKQPPNPLWLGSSGHHPIAMPGLGALEQRVANLDQRVGTLDQRVIALEKRVTDNRQVLLETIHTNQRWILEQRLNNQEQMQNDHRDSPVR